MVSVYNKVALVTGAAKGIGLTISKALLEKRGKVALLDIQEEAGQEACETLRKVYGKDRVTFYKCDVTSAENLRSVFEKTVAKFGKLDIVVNNAGVVEEINWRKAVDINLVDLQLQSNSKESVVNCSTMVKARRRGQNRGQNPQSKKSSIHNSQDIRISNKSAVIQGTYLGIEFMSKQNNAQGGLVVNISSYAGLLPEPTTPVYSATKAGVIAFTESLRSITTSDGVRVNCVCPTWVDTDMGNMVLGEYASDRVKETVKRATLLSPELVADAVLLLVQDTSKAGAVARVTPRNGVDFHKFDRKPLFMLMQKL
ncbi:15-hydroxyprostaglandin dehydrogenase [NAD(+)]-like isoform X1 [Dysidea avara]|uniref:15-hydroxyprostaglandin dehydrogenase [NAD(+)]-like isoform X1 n=1 Tax=Dysidea avara TaxID=196820 RepID=UPI003330456C